MLTHDSRGRESRTLLLVWVAFLAITARYILGGLVDGIPHMDALDYAGSSSLVVAWWLGREWQVRKTGEPMGQ